MDAQHRQRCEEVLIGLRDMRASKSLSEGLYFKCLVALSWEWLAADELRPCLSLLQEVDPKYYLGEMKHQMAEDPKFTEVVCCIAGRLVDTQVIDLEPPLRPTQAPAKA